MSFSDILKKTAELAVLPKHTTAIILAAGSGERFSRDSRVKTDEKKQFVNVLGKPVLLRTAEVFESSRLINEIVVVTSLEDIPRCRELLEPSISKLRCVVSGGSSRQESAMAGLEAAASKTDYVAVHDAARCLITKEIIEETVREAYRTGAAAAAERAVDTVKYATSDRNIESTIDREHVWLVKTPQVFKANIYRVALYTAFRDGITLTDDCMAAEQAGFKIRLVDCGHENIKLTYAVDLVTAEAILRYRQNDGFGGNR